jgi:hypothetical protein
MALSAQTETAVAPGSGRDITIPFLRAEGAAGLAAALAAYSITGGSWLLFAAVFLAPDLSFAAYWVGPQKGALGYNLAHWSLPAAALAAFGWWSAWPILLHLGLIWLAHIAFDRMVGYGLKRPTAFGDTHLGWKGPRPIAETLDA